MSNDITIHRFHSINGTPRVEVAHWRPAGESGVELPGLEGHWGLSMVSSCAARAVVPGRPPRLDGWGQVIAEGVEATPLPPNALYDNPLQDGVEILRFAEWLALATAAWEARVEAFGPDEAGPRPPTSPPRYTTSAGIGGERELETGWSILTNS